jgi:hypothetical protein
MESKMDTKQVKIKSSLIADDTRRNFLINHLGSYAIQFEQMVYKLSDMLIEDYNGGYWEFYELSNGGLYMELQTSEMVFLMQ